MGKPKRTLSTPLAGFEAGIIVASSRSLLTFDTAARQCVNHVCTFRKRTPKLGVSQNGGPSVGLQFKGNQNEPTVGDRCLRVTPNGAGPAGHLLNDHPLPPEVKMTIEAQDPWQTRAYSGTPKLMFSDYVSFSNPLNQMSWRRPQVHLPQPKSVKKSDAFEAWRPKTFRLNGSPESTNPMPFSLVIFTPSLNKIKKEKNGRVNPLHWSSS